MLRVLFYSSFQEGVILVSIKNIKNIQKHNSRIFLKGGLSGGAANAGASTSTLTSGMFIFCFNNF